MIPIYLGPPERRLFGWHHPPAAREVRGGVVICGPFGWEYTRSYRSFRHLAERLAAAGFHALRFDYDGTGDSAGGDSDPGRVAAWLASIGAAADELRARAGLDRVSLFGVRLGATLAARAAASRDDVTSLVAWGPLATGRAFVRESRAFRRLASSESGQGLAEGEEEAGGYLLTAETVEALGGVDLPRLERPPAPRVLILARDETSPEDRLAEEMRARGAEVDFRRVPGFAPMVMNEVHDSVVPDEVFAVATRWLEEDPAAAPRPAAAAVPEAGPPACVLAVDGARVTEEAVCFGPDARLFGILTRSAASDPARPAVVFLNNGAVHRVGSQRMYVSMAREWAARGWTTLRMDLSGLGDSRPSPGRGENVMYAGDAVDDVRAGLEWLATTHGHRRFVLLGLCAGAHASFHAALSGGNVAGIVLINPQTFYFKEGDPLDVAPSEVYSRWQKYQGSFWSREKWTKLMRGAVPLRDLAGVMLARARIIATARGSAVVRAVRRRHRGTLSGDLPALVRTGTDVFMVFSARDPGLDYIELHARSEVRALLGLPNFGIEIIEGPDHTFTPVWSQRRLLEVVTARLVQRHAGRA